MKTQNIIVTALVAVFAVFALESVSQSAPVQTQSGEASAPRSAMTNCMGHRGMMSGGMMGSGMMAGGMRGHAMMRSNWRPDRNPGRFQIGAGGFAAHTRGTFDPPQRPAEASQG